MVLKRSARPLSVSSKDHFSSPFHRSTNGYFTRARTQEEEKKTRGKRESPLLKRRMFAVKRLRSNYKIMAIKSERMLSK